MRAKNPAPLFSIRARASWRSVSSSTFLDEYLKNNPGEIDYIHDDDALIGFAKQENAIGFLLPAMEKSQLFRGVIADGVLPRKTFSMGHSREKRYYLEGRKIK